MQYLIAFCSRPEAAGDVISRSFVAPILTDKYVKFCDLCLNHSREIPPEAVGGCTFRYNFPTEVDIDAIFSVAVECVGMDAGVKFGESRSNGSRDILWADFVSNKQTNEHELGQSHKAQKPYTRFT